MRSPGRALLFHRSLTLRAVATKQHFVCHRWVSISGVLPASTLLYDLPRVFVLAQSEENWLTQFFVASPFGEFDLADELGIYPMHFAHHPRADALHPLAALLGRKIDKWTILAGFGLKFLVQDRQ